MLTSKKNIKSSVQTDIKVPIYLPYKGGAIKLILIGNSIVESDKPALRAVLTASIPS